MIHCLVNHHITRHQVFGLVSAEWIMMCPATDNPTSCEIHAVNMCTVEIHIELCMAYGQNWMSEGIIRQWFRMFKDGQTNGYDDEWSGWSSVVSDDIVQSVDQNFVEDGTSQFQNIHVNFHTFHALYETVTVRLGCHKFCARWVVEMLKVAHKMLRMTLALTFYRVIPWRWWWISQLHRTSNRWWNQGFIRECWNQRAVREVDAHTFTKQAEKV
jgi:hypothetical protein